MPSAKPNSPSGINHKLNKKCTVSLFNTPKAIYLRVRVTSNTAKLQLRLDGITKLSNNWEYRHPASRYYEIFCHLYYV